MAVTATVYARDEAKGPYGGNPAATPYHLWRVPVSIAGTYATGGFQIDLCQAITSARQAVNALTVNWVKAFGDYYDSSALALTVSDAQTALASGGTATSISSASTNNLATLKLYTGTNGSGGSELTNGTAVNGTFVILVAATYTISGPGQA